jgi:hypothetical protein
MRIIAMLHGVRSNDKNQINVGGALEEEMTAQ